MVEKLNIVQSTTEPDKNNIWLKDNELKKFGAKGWSTIGGGGVSLDSPQVSEPSGSELVPINDNGENKVITIDNLLNKGKDVCKVILDSKTNTLVNYSEVLDALENGNNYFIIKEENDSGASYYNFNIRTIIYIKYERYYKEATFGVLQDNKLIYMKFALMSGRCIEVKYATMIPQVSLEEIPILNTGATLEDVITAHNRLLLILFDV